MKKLVISLGGSVLFKGRKLNEKLLRELKGFISKFDGKIVIVVGGGWVAREFQEFGKKLGVRGRELDEIGIAATKLNAELVRSFLGIKNVYDDPKYGKKKGKVLVFSGWRPGASTDYVAVKVAKVIGAKDVINLSISGGTYKNEKLVKKISWKEVKKMMKKWEPGFHFPIDPKACREGEGLRYYIIKEFKEIENIMKGKPFKGTLIQ